MFVYYYYCFPAHFNINYIFLIVVFRNLIILFITFYNITISGCIHVTQIIPSFFVTFMLNFGIFFPLCKKPKKFCNMQHFRRILRQKNTSPFPEIGIKNKKTKNMLFFIININFHI